MYIICLTSNPREINPYQSLVSLKNKLKIDCHLLQFYMDYAYPKILENKHIRFALFYFISASQHYPNELLQKKRSKFSVNGNEKELFIFYTKMLVLCNR